MPSRSNPDAGRGLDKPLQSYLGSSPTTHPLAAICPACYGSTHESTLYRQFEVPVQSCLLPSTAAHALAVQRRDIELLNCHECGLIFNRCFDPESQRFDADYEETQGFSPVFQRFARQLGQALDHRWSLAGKTVLEVGCGKGDFLAELCHRHGCKGIGIDPAFDRGRRPQNAGCQVRYEARLFDREDIGLRADYLICRHTLEHIGPVGEFLDIIAQAVRSGGVREVFFDVPDAARILDEGAFWDIYYEHANYFTAQALAQAFVRAGFEVTGMSRLFHEQYLGLFARPATRVRVAPESPVAAADASSLTDSLARWRHTLAESPAPLVIWGSGSKGVAFLHAADCDRRVSGAVDINPYRQGRFMPGIGLAILAPDDLVDSDPQTVVIMNPAYRDEIQTQLRALNLQPRLLSV